MWTLEKIKKTLQVRGDENNHEQTDAWANRDLIPLPPDRRTWAIWAFFGYWSLDFMNVSAWQVPGTFLTEGLSVGQTMAIVVVSRVLVGAFTMLIAVCGLKWHIGFTVQSRMSWGHRGSFIPLIQRIFLNFIWTAYQCWNGGRLVAVCLTAIWPSFGSMKNTMPASFPATTSEFIGYIVFWALSIPFLLIRPEKFGHVFRIICTGCGIAMIVIVIWIVCIAHGVGPIFHQQNEVVTKTSIYNTAWLVIGGINTSVGGCAAGITNASDFGRYGKSRRIYALATFLSAVVVGSLVALIGLAVAAAGQKAYGEVYWNPPDIFLQMIKNGHGSAKSRAGMFICSFLLLLTNMFQNICGNAVAGGIDLSGIFPRYINIRRGAMITFLFAWVVQPWQLINRATTLLSVLSSFSVFLGPLVGIMAADYYLVRNRRVKLRDFYYAHSSYWYTGGFNWRVFPAWLAGWGPTVGGLIMSVNSKVEQNHGLLKLYQISFFVGFTISFTIFYITNLIFPPPGAGTFDDYDYYGTFTKEEADRLGVVPIPSLEGEDGESTEQEPKGNVGNSVEEVSFQQNSYVTGISSKLRGFLKK